MADPQKAVETQLHNIQQRSGKPMSALFELLRASGLAKHGELRDFLKRELGLGHGDANALVHHFLGQGQGDAPAAATRPEPDSALDTLYPGPKAALRPVHEALMRAAQGFGEFEIAPKRAYLSLRRKKQFAMIGPATQSKIELGLNMKGVAGSARLVEQAPGGMCNYKLRLGSVDEVDAEVLGWLRTAYDSAG